MNGRAVALGLCLLATVVGCSTEEPALGKKDITAAEVCELMPAADVGEALDLPLTAAKPQDLNVARLNTAVLCRYHGESLEVPFVAVKVHLWRVELIQGDKVEAAFTAADGTPVDYEAVDDLGDAAGFGPSPDLPDTYQLTTVTEYSDGYREVTVEVDGKKPDLDQLRGITEQILPKLDAS